MRPVTTAKPPKSESDRLPGHACFCVKQSQSAQATRSLTTESLLSHPRARSVPWKAGLEIGFPATVANARGSRPVAFADPDKVPKRH